MTWINRALIAIAAALIVFAIGRFVLKSWIFAAAGAGGHAEKGQGEHQQ